MNGFQMNIYYPEGCHRHQAGTFSFRGLDAIWTNQPNTYEIMMLGLLLCVDASYLFICISSSDNGTIL